VNMSKSSDPERLNTYVSLMYELKNVGKVFTSKFVGTEPSSYEKRNYRAAVSQRLRNTSLCYLYQNRSIYGQHKKNSGKFSMSEILSFQILTLESRSTECFI